MQQRRLRPGDILDDYCPRERRVTNHVVVAMIEEGVKQTRCSTCDAEHEYKEAKSPVLRRAKVVPTAPPSPAFVGGPGSGSGGERNLESDSDSENESDGSLNGRLDGVVDRVVDAVLDDTSSARQALPGGASSADAPAADANLLNDDVRNDDGSVHRRLIRATLPRPAGHVPERKITEFTVRQPGARAREGDGNRGARFRGPRPQGARYSNDTGPRFGSGSGGGGGFGGRPGQGDAPRGTPSPGPGRGPRPGGAGRKRGR